MKTLMKGAALAALATVAMASSAQAAHFVGNYTVDAYDGNNGLEIETWDNPNNIVFDLNSIGQSSTEALFRIYTTEDTVDASDLQPRAIKVHFTFTSPSNFGGDVNGTTFGELDGKYQNGHVTWNDPVVLTFNGGQLKVTMNDADFNKGYKELNGGFYSGADISANFQLISGAVPEPATWAMMITGFGMAGVALRRRRYASVAA